MRLLCPHCRNEIQVGDHLAGQVQSCPRCQKLFRVPVPPPSAGVTSPSVFTPPATGPAAPPGKSDGTTAAVPFSQTGTGGPAPQGPVVTGAAQTVSPPQPVSTVPGVSPLPGAMAPAAAPPITFAPPQQPPVSLPPPVPSPGYTASVTLLVLQPTTVQISQLVVFFALAVLLFCPWIKIPPKTGVLLSQNGFHVAFGQADGSLVTKEAATKETKPTQETRLGMRTSPLAVLYFFLVVMGSIVGAMIAIATVLDWPELRPYLRFRHLLMGGLSMLAVLMLYLQILTGFPAVDAWMSINKPGAGAMKARTPILGDEKADWLIPVIQSLADAPGDYVTWAWGLHVSLLLTLILVLLVLLDFWLQRRAQLLPPRLLLEK